jgi:hypothetical protein
VIRATTPWERIYGQATAATLPRAARDARPYPLPWGPALADLLHQGLYCHHRAVINADRWPDETVLLDLDRRAVCTRCPVSKLANAYSR